MDISERDLQKYPHLRKALGLPEQPQYSADDEIIPKHLLAYEPEPLPPIVVVHHGTNRLFSAALALGLAILLVPMLIIFCILGAMEPAGLLGIIVGALAMYGLTHRRDGLE